MKLQNTISKTFYYPIIAIIFVIIFISSLFVSSLMNRFYYNNLGDITYSAVNNIQNKIQSYLDDAKFTASMSSLTSYLTYREDGDTTSDASKSTFTQVYNFFYNKAAYSSSVSEICLVSNSNEVLISNDAQMHGTKFLSSSIYGEMISQGIISTYIEADNNSNLEIIIGVPTKVYSKQVGFLFFKINFKSLLEVVSGYSLGSTGSIFFITEGGNFVSNNNDNTPTSVLSIKNNMDMLSKIGTDPSLYKSSYKLNETSHTMAYSSVNNLKIIVCTSISNNEINRMTLSILFPLYLLFLFIVALFFIYRSLISRKVLRPLNLLNRSIRKLQHGDLSARFNYNKEDEFGSLSSTFNKTISDLQDVAVDLNERNEKNKIVLDMITDVVWEYSFDTKSITLTENWGLLLGHEETEKQYIYQIDDLLKYFYEDDIQKFIPIYEATCKNHTPLNYECRLRLSEYQHIWIKINAICITDAYGENTKMFGSFFNISDFKNRESELINYAILDDMTGLLKKVELQRLVTSKIESDRSEFFMFILDIDKFKSINDTYGHLVGDEVIIHVANILKSICTSTCRLSRFGGDEFLGVTNVEITRDEFADIAQKICSKIRQGYVSKANEYIPTTCSMGIASFPHDGDTYLDVLSSADNAIYVSKNTGRDKFTFFDEKYYQNN